MPAPYGIGQTYFAEDVVPPLLAQDTHWIIDNGNRGSSHAYCSVTLASAVMQYRQDAISRLTIANNPFEASDKKAIWHVDNPEW